MIDSLQIKTDSLKQINPSIKQDTFTHEKAIDYLEVVVWPIIAIIIVLILKKSIADLFSRINKFQFAGVNAEASQQKQESLEKVNLEKLDDKKTVNQLADKVLGMFSMSTISKAAELVNNESQVNTLDNDKDKVDVLFKYSQALYLTISFERTYNLIFGSQLYILEKVNTFQNEPKDELKKIYDNAKHKHPEFYSTYNFDDYLNFLTGSDLVVVDNNDLCNITFLGRDFLKYLIENGKSFNKAY